MWVNKSLFQQILDDNKKQHDAINELLHANAMANGISGAAMVQKAKDDITIDWMRHRVNALEKLNALMLGKVAGIHVPIPEIVPTRPGSVSVLQDDLSYSPSFEDVGDSEAQRLGIIHDQMGTVAYTK